MKPLLPFEQDSFANRHIGPSEAAVDQMLGALGYTSLEALIDTAVPDGIRLRRPLDLPGAMSESDATRVLAGYASKNRVLRSYLGMGYSDCFVPGVIRRNVFENPGWYTQYTPYQAEIAQGRLEALLNFQTMVVDLCGLPVANASLLDEATAAAEGMAMARAARKDASHSAFFVSDACHPQTVAVVRGRAEPLGVEIVVGDAGKVAFDRRYFGLLLQYPATDGKIVDYTPLCQAAHERGALVIVAADLLSLVLLKSPGEMGADVAVGSSQRFGVPLGFGGPHAAFFAVKEELERRLPGRLVGVSHDRRGKHAVRLALQTREQHIRREKATSNICTAQVLLAVMAGMYAVYHGPTGLLRIARRVRDAAALLAAGLRKLGHSVGAEPFFDTVRVTPGGRGNEILAEAARRGMNFRSFAGGDLGLAFDETTTQADLLAVLGAFAPAGKLTFSLQDLTGDAPALPDALRRTSEILTHPVFRKYGTETEMLRYIRKLESKDLSLTTSMIPLGSCTMKLNATTEMLPVSWPEFSGIHPFAPADQTEGYRLLFRDLEAWLAEITGFSAVSLQPNSGAQGEYAGLLVIRRYHQARGQGHRNVCLIPRSAHGTNPASATMAGMKVVVVECDQAGNIDIADLQNKAETHAADLAALMVTYPSTHGVFERRIREICDVIHARGGQVYMDGANLNAQLGVCRPGDFGPDVCHLNLHKTFCIPHGGGGPGMGPIAVARHLADYLPGHPVAGLGGKESIAPVSAAPWGSASILTISWMYIRMMGGDGLLRATQVAILNANYVAKKLGVHFPVLFQGNKGLVAHECILDMRELKKRADVEVEDVAKRLMDYGFHAPTMSWPVAGTMMVEPTESEPLAELDRFVAAMVGIHGEAKEIVEGKLDRADNPLKNAPHTVEDVVTSEWTHAYSRERAAFPAPWTRERKFWPSVGRIDNTWGDRNIFCTCPPVDPAEG